MNFNAISFFGNCFDRQNKMSETHHASIVKNSTRKGCCPKRKPSSQTPRIISAILHGKATLIQSYRAVNLYRFEHVNDKDDAMVVIAEEWPFGRRKVSPEKLSISKQAGKYFEVVCAYKTSSDCITRDSKKK